MAASAPGARCRGESRLLADSVPAVAAMEPRPPCYLERASLWSLLTFGYVGMPARSFEAVDRRCIDDPFRSIIIIGQQTTPRWMTPVIKMGNKRVLTEGDMPELPKVDTAEHLRDLAQVCYAMPYDQRPVQGGLLLVLVLVLVLVLLLLAARRCCIVHACWATRSIDRSMED
jgi:hypothetical protein